MPVAGEYCIKVKEQSREPSVRRVRWSILRIECYGHRISDTNSPIPSNRSLKSLFPISWTRRNWRWLRDRPASYARSNSPRRITIESCDSTKAMNLRLIDAGRNSWMKGRNTGYARSHEKCELWMRKVCSSRALSNTAASDYLFETLLNHDIVMHTWSRRHLIFHWESYRDEANNILRQLIVCGYRGRKFWFFEIRWSKLEISPGSSTDSVVASSESRFQFLLPCLRCEAIW